jgi:hypothetical protein
LHFLSRSRRKPRVGERTAGKSVTFIVTLAALGDVTLAARAAGMSRKSAYALRSRDPAFAAAWMAALRAGERRSVGPAPSLSKGDKVEEVEGPPIPSGLGNASPSRAERERAFVGLLVQLRESPPLAPRPAAQ